MELKHLSMIGEATLDTQRGLDTVYQLPFALCPLLIGKAGADMQWKLQSKGEAGVKLGEEE